jgi:hypothetical protein
MLSDEAKAALREYNTQASAKANPKFTRRANNHDIVEIANNDEIQDILPSVEEQVAEPDLVQTEDQPSVLDDNTIEQIMQACKSMHTRYINTTKIIYNISAAQSAKFWFPC